MECKSFNYDDQNCGDLVGNEEDKQETNLVSEVNDVHYDEPNEEPTIAKECENSLVEEVKEKIDSTVESPKLKKPEETAADEAALVKQEVETLSKGSQHVKELPQNSEKDIENTPKIKDKNVNLVHYEKYHKITPVNKERNEIRIKRKPACPVKKTPQFSTTRASKPTSTPTTSSASGPHQKQEELHLIPYHRPRIMWQNKRKWLLDPCACPLV